MLVIAFASRTAITSNGRRSRLRPPDVDRRRHARRPFRPGCTPARLIWVTREVSTQSQVGCSMTKGRLCVRIPRCPSVHVRALQKVVHALHIDAIPLALLAAAVVHCARLKCTYTDDDGDNRCMRTMVVVHHRRIRTRSPLTGHGAPFQLTCCSAFCGWLLACHTRSCGPEAHSIHAAIDL